MDHFDDLSRVIYKGVVMDGAQTQDFGNLLGFGLQPVVIEIHSCKSVQLKLTDKALLLAKEV